MCTSPSISKFRILCILKLVLVYSSVFLNSEGINWPLYRYTSTFQLSKWYLCLCGQSDMAQRGLVKNEPTQFSKSIG